MSRKKRRSNNRKAKKQKKYSYLFHISTQPRKFLQPYRTSFCYDSEEDRAQALLFLCPREEIKNWMDWVSSKSREKSLYKKLCQGGYMTLYVHVVRVYIPDLIIPFPRYGNEFVVKDRLRPRAIVPMRFYYHKKINISKLNSTLKRLNDVKVKV